ncbi:MAG: hypothetical protein IPL41_01425 [Micropruina sp.]|nr:hypothetical protein [Micropruina sp.]
MAKLTFYTEKLTASKGTRMIAGLLLPFNEVGFTNLGKITATKDSKISISDNVILNVEHQNKRPIGKAEVLQPSDTGVNASFRVLATRDGDDALTEVEEGVRCALSVEMEPVVVKDGKLVSGTITGAGLVTEPAFASARLAAAAAEDVPDLDDEPPTVTPTVTLPEVVIDGDKLESVTDVKVSDEKIEVTTAKPDAPVKTKKEETVMAANATVNNAALVADAGNPADDKNALFAMLAGVHQEGLSPRKMEAALSDIVPGNILGVEQPQYVGQLWAGVPYERRYIPVFDHADLTSFNMTGWDWADGKEPAVGLYSGNKTDIPSNAVETVAANGVIQRIAGGHDIDRKFRDFSNTEFWDAYFAKMAESYAKVSDTYIRDQAKAAIPAGAQRVHLLSGGAPAGVPPVLWQIVEGCVKMLDDLGTLPTFAFVTSDYWKPLFYTKQNDVLAYLNAALGFEEGSLENGGFKIIPVPVGSLTNGAWIGKTVIGHKSALKVYELPGSPIRVEAEAISKGGVDEALFGYIGYMVEEAKGPISFDAPAAA